MKKSRKLFIYLLLNIAIIITFAGVTKSAELVDQRQTCEQYGGIEFPLPGLVLTYENLGQDLVKHRIVNMIEGDKIVIETTIFDGTKVVKSYTQHIHRVSRQIVWTSEPITDRLIPGVLPQSDYTDIWIPSGSEVGSHVNIANTTQLVGSSDETHVYVGDASNKTKQDSRMYARSVAAGIFEGYNTHAPSPKLKKIEKCFLPPTPDKKIIATTTTNDNFSKNDESSIKILITNNGEPILEPIVDFEIFDESDNRVFQTFTELKKDEVPSQTTRELVFKWTPEKTGHHVGKLGIFTPNWQNLLYWNNSLMPDINVTEQTISGAVVLSGAFITSTPYYLSQRAILHAQFKTENPPSKPVLIDLELYNANGQKVAQSWFDNLKIENLETIDKTLDVPFQLPGGDYTLKVGIFNPGWNGLISWQNEALKFKLHDFGQWEDEVVLLSFVSPKTGQAPAGKESTFVVSIMSPNTQNHAKLELILKNKNGETAAKREYNNIALPRSGTGNYENIYTLQTPANLATGTYHLEVNIYKENGQELIRSYIDAATLEVLEK